MATTENPCEEVVWTFSTPSTPPIAPSTGWLTCSSTKSGPAPGTGVETSMTGKSTSGRSSWLSRAVAKIPLPMSRSVARNTTLLFPKHQLTTRPMGGFLLRAVEAFDEQSQAFQERPSLLVCQRVHGFRKPPTAALHHPTRYILHPWRVVYEDHPPVGRIVAPMDHLVFLQVVDELDHGRGRNSDRPGQLADRVRSSSQRDQDLHVPRG